MRKFLLVGVLALIGISLLAATHSRAINRIKLYRPGFFPSGRLYKANDLISLPNGTWQGKVYLDEAIVFKDNGVPDGRGYYTYTAKVDHSIVGSWYASMMHSAASKALFEITIPYKAPISLGLVYQFTNISPLTVVRRRYGLK